MGSGSPEHVSVATSHMTRTVPVAPPEIRTPRLRMRPWRADDAALLLPVLSANIAHLAPWIPAHVATPVPLDQLAVRLAGFADDVAAARSWRFALFPLHADDVCGEASLFFRSASGRVTLPEADRAEIGYWLRSDITGHGLATEAARALLDVAATLPGIAHVEIRCDPRNLPSAAVPQRLGFHLAALERTTPDAEPDTMVWAYALQQATSQ